jgi:NitT/TauT family transport system permease protein
MQVARIGLGVGVVALWQLVAVRVHDNPFLVPPTDVVTACFHLLRDGSLTEHLLTTGRSVLIAFGTASVAGVACGLVLSASRATEQLLAPYLTFLNTIPRVALIPAFIVWFGIGPEASIAVGISLTFFIVLLNTIAAAKNIDRDLVRLSDTVGLSTVRRFGIVTLPWCVPGIFAGLHLGLIYAILGVIAGEMLAGTTGLGQLIVLYGNTFRVEQMYAVILIVAVLSAAVIQGFALLEARLLRWTRV